jgi:outer membrane protein
MQKLASMKHFGHPTRSIRPGRVMMVFLALGALLSLLGQAHAQDRIQIGYVDMERLFDNAPQVVAAREALDQDFRPRNESLLADEARLEQMRQQLAEAEDLEAEARFDMEREIRNLSRSIDRRREDLSEELRFRTNAEKKALEETIELAIREVANDGSYDLVLSSPVAFASPTIDITDLVLEWLREDFPKDNHRNRR